MSEQLKSLSYWELMQVARNARDAAKMAKANKAADMEKVREVLEAVRSMRYWLTAAHEQGRTLKARKLVMAQGESELVAKGQASVGYVCDQLASPALATNIRDSFSWFRIAANVTLFKEWEEVVREFELAASAAIIRLDVLLSNTKCDWKAARDSVKKASAKVQKYSRERLPAVATRKAVRKEAIRVYCAKKVTQVFSRGTDNRILYSVVNAPSNTYRLVSAAGCISEREKGTVLGIKNWLRLVRTTRYNHINRNVHNWNNRQDYLVRLPSYTGGGALYLR